MKKQLFVLILMFVVSCSQVPKKSAQNPQFFGEFLYLSDAAVLNTGTEIYGVVIDEKMQELDDLCTSIKRNEYDMIPKNDTQEIVNHFMKEVRSALESAS